MSSVKDAGTEESVENQATRGASQSLNMEPLLGNASLNQCSRHENAADCDWACGHFSLVGSELVQEAEGEGLLEEGGLNRESVNDNHPLQLGESLTPIETQTPKEQGGGGVNGGEKAAGQGHDESHGGHSHSPEDKLSQRMKQAFLSGVEGSPKKEGQPEVSANQSEPNAQLTANQRTQSSPPPDLCQMEKTAMRPRLEKTASGTTFTSFWRRPGLQLFRKTEEAQVTPQLKDSRSLTSPTSSRATSPTGPGRRSVARTTSAPLNVTPTKSVGSQQAALRSSPAQRGLFRSPESSPDAFSYFEPPRSHQQNYEGEQSVNAHYLHKTRSEPQQWNQSPPETVVENVEWNMEEEDEDAEGRAGNFGRESETRGGGECVGGSAIRGGRAGIESQVSNAPSWVDYSTVTEEGYHERGLVTPHSENPAQNPASPALGGSGISNAQGESAGGAAEGKRRRRRNRGKGRKKASSERGAVAEAGENDSVASDSSSLQGLQGSGVLERGGSFTRGVGEGAKRVGNKIDVHLAAKKAGGANKGEVGSQQVGSEHSHPEGQQTKVSGANLRASGVLTSAQSEGKAKDAASHQGDGSSDVSSVNASVSEPREPRLAGDRWQHVVRKETSEEGPDVEDETEDIELVEEENDSDAASDADLSDADDQTNQELTRGTRIRDNFYPAQDTEEQARSGMNKAGHGVNTGERSEDYGGREEQWESERGVGFNKWHIVAMVGCSILTAFVGGRLYFEHLRRQEAKRRAEKTCRIPVPFGFGEVEVAEVLRPLVCPKDHRGYV
ncbi:hypothetical protein KFL_000420060 [Klebsormidium nitens]|uniref:Transmembrane protein n=1 Tax=Klebsormidium nitens TaxID=105231 RepID=A0A1Y1HMT8_KLENI|nr:hypothetical protein KFL_000420060 [Klebsormidium nitens]|eukprot:GAQ79934.1 hypothetical protein KFL_000420060 [Klebsormidium nitens]